MHHFQWKTPCQATNWPHRKARYARRLVEDREAHDAAYEKKVASGEAAHAAALLEKARLAPVQPHRAAFEADFVVTASADKKLSLSKGVDGDGTVYEIPLQYRSTMMSFSSLDPLPLMTFFAHSSSSSLS